MFFLALIHPCTGIGWIARIVRHGHPRLHLSRGLWVECPCACWVLECWIRVRSKIIMPHTPLPSRSVCGEHRKESSLLSWVSLCPIDTCQRTERGNCPFAFLDLWCVGVLSCKWKITCSPPPSCSCWCSSFFAKVCPWSSSSSPLDVSLRAMNNKVCCSHRDKIITYRLFDCNCWFQWCH